MVLLETFQDDGLLRQIAAENNVPETDFLVPDNDNYCLRWFTLRSRYRCAAMLRLQALQLSWSGCSQDGRR